MGDLASIVARAGQMLGELAELDLGLARATQAAAVAAAAADDPEQLASLSRAYARVARSLRQTLLLQVRLVRDAAREAREDAPKPDLTRVWVREEELRTAVGRVIAREAPERAEALEDAFEDRLFLRACKADFCDPPLDEQVVAFCVELGLPAETARAWRDLADPRLADEDDEPAPWRSSA